MSSLLAQWWAEARDATGSEAEAVGVIAERLGESQTETRRLLTTIARVKVGGTRGKRVAKPTARPAVSESVNVPALDADAMRSYYRNGRESGLKPEHALRAVAKRYGVRPHDARLIVSDVEAEVRAA